MFSHTISKSRYLSGHQCLKKLYFEKFRPELKPETSFSQQALFDQGHSVGDLAQRLFPGGKDATPESYYDFGPSISKTAQWIEAGTPVIYEAAFLFQKTLAALDILVKRNGELHSIEVKSSTSVRDYHIIDGSLQYWVMSNAGCRPDRFFLMHINNEYVRNGELDPAKLFTLQDITEQVVALQEEVPENLHRMNEMLSSGTEPEVAIGKHCSSPFGCDFTHYCWQHIPTDSIFTLRNFRKAWQYYNKGILAIEDLPEEDRFSAKQQLQINGVKTGEQYIDKEKISQWLSQWEYPLYFFDFETINPGLPIYDNTRPYQQLPVQYSLHVLKSPDSELEHIEYLADFDDDPRQELILRMLEDLGHEGHIIAYNTPFEKRLISALAAAYPLYADQLNALNDRFLDLITPFRKGWYYTPAMKGSYSIKYVLPALCQDPKLSYSGLNITNGGDASVYLAALAEKRITPEEISEIRKDLLEYCKLDTLAMVEIWRKLCSL